jgi:hypothetical protein
LFGMFSANFLSCLSSICVQFYELGLSYGHLNQVIKYIVVFQYVLSL